MRRFLSFLLRLLLVLTLAAALYAGLRLWHVRQEITRAEHLLQTLRADVFADDVPDLPGTPAPDAAPDAACPVDWDALRARCPGALAWLSGCDGAIDTPIVQGTDNLFYLTHLADGTENLLGAAFLDSANRADFADDQSFLFGHHLSESGGAFAPLLQYAAQEYFDAHPAFLLHTPHGCWRAEVFAACAAPRDFAFYTCEFADTAERLRFLDTMRAESDILSPVEPAPGDRFLTLCTCVTKSSDEQTLRYLVCARLVPLSHIDK